MQYGFSVFEGIRCYATDHGPAVFRLDEHVERLLDSAHIVGFRELPLRQGTDVEAIHQTIAANEFSACYIRPMIYLDGAMRMTVEAGQAAVRGRGVGVERRFSAPRPRNAAFAPILLRSRGCIRTS